MSEYGKKMNPVSLSIGVAQYNKEDSEAGFQGENADNLIKRSDMAMYEAKRAGGDQVVKAKAFIGRGHK
jgi:GGDEF domain-containing protein